MEKSFKEILSTVEPIPDSIYGPKYRCSLSLKDGTHLPCVVLQSKSKLVELAKRRLKEESSWKKKLLGPDPYGQVLSVFVAAGNRVNEYDVASANPSKFAPPLALLKQIHGETTMGWTGWVFEMRDGKQFTYGSSYHMEFLDVPEGYSFADVTKVHNHSFVTKDGSLGNLQQGGMLTAEYRAEKVLRERVFSTATSTASKESSSRNSPYGPPNAGIRTRKDEPAGTHDNGP